MAVDLNKSHYDEHGNKTPRSVTPENTAEEIYPGRKSSEENKGTYESKESSSSDEKAFSFSDDFGNDMKKLGKGMGELGKNFGEMIEKHGENFGEIVEKYGEKFGEQIEENMKKVFSTENNTAKNNFPKKFETAGENYPTANYSSSAPAVNKKEKKKHRRFSIVIAALVIICIAFLPAAYGCLTAYYEDNSIYETDNFFVDTPDKLTVSCDNAVIYVVEGTSDTVGVSYNLTNAELVTKTVTDKTGISTEFYTQKSDNAKNNPLLTVNGDVTVSVPANYSGVISIEGESSPIYVSTGKTITVSGKNSEINLTDIQNAESIVCENKNSAVNIENVSVKSIDADCKNGTIDMTNTAVSGNTLLDSDNGKINVIESTLSGDSTLTADNGSIVFDKAVLENARISSDNGSVQGTLIGKKSDYKITASADNGSSNLSDTNSGKYTLNVTADNGSINLDFE